MRTVTIPSSMAALLVIGCLAFSVPAVGQIDTAWVRRYNGPANGEDKAVAIAVDHSGNVYVTGESFGSGTSCDFATIKYLSTGDTAWVRRYNGTANGEDKARAIAVDDSGNVYVAGSSWGGNTDLDYLIIGYDPDGIQLWAKRYDGPAGGEDIAYALAVDDSGNVYVTGASSGNGTSHDYATIKYYPSGDTAWVRRYNGPVNGSDQA
ncbi:MAG: SBBP repeat-containing protein, partial [Candidatus Zixiibacteriota bacterium]